MPDFPLIRVYLDANVLFSAAYRDGNRLQNLWRLQNVYPVTSYYAIEEVRRHAVLPAHALRLEALLAKIGIISDADTRCIHSHIKLPFKDRPILAAAIFASIDYLVTGDTTHFGHLYNTAVSHVKILTPAEFLRIHFNRLKN